MLGMFPSQASVLRRKSRLFFLWEISRHPLSIIKTDGDSSSQLNVNDGMIEGNDNDHKYKYVLSNIIN